MMLLISVGSLFDIYFNQERDKKYWNINKAQQKVSFMKEHLLFIHAWSQYNSTSSFFGYKSPVKIRYNKIS